MSREAKLRVILAKLLVSERSSDFSFAGYRFRHATSDDERRAAFALRYHVFTEEGYVEAERLVDRYFYDEFDRVSIQLLAFGPEGDLAGTTRLVLPSSLGFSTERLFTLNPPPAIARNHVAELGRLAVHPRHRGGDRAAMLGLIKLACDGMAEHSVAYLYAFMPYRLMRSYRLLGLGPRSLPALQPDEQTLRRRSLMRGYFRQKDVRPVLFSRREIAARMEAILWRRRRRQERLAEPKAGAVLGAALEGG